MRVDQYDFANRMFSYYPVTFLQKYPPDYGLEISCIRMVEVFGITKVGRTSLVVYREKSRGVPLVSGKTEMGPVAMLPVEEFKTYYSEWEKAEPEPRH